MRRGEKRGEGSEGERGGGSGRWEERNERERRVEKRGGIRCWRYYLTGHNELINHRLTNSD